MRFTVKDQPTPNIEKYPSSDYDLAKKFAEAIRQEIPDFIKAVVLFGSAAREPTHQGRDIDLLIIINDLTLILSDEVIQSYRVIVTNTAKKISQRFHITTLKTTTFWDYVRNGDPIMVNMLRDGVALYDTGFFAPVQQLLFQGRIRPSKESVWIYFARAPNTMHNADWHVLQACMDLYWAVVDSAHAAIMQEGEVPPTPAHLPQLITKRLVMPGIVPKKYADKMDFFYKMSKQIQRREVQTVTGAQYDQWRKDAWDFVRTMQKVVEHR